MNSYINNVCSLIAFWGWEKYPFIKYFKQNTSSGIFENGIIWIYYIKLDIALNSFPIADLSLWV